MASVCALSIAEEEFLRPYLPESTRSALSETPSEDPTDQLHDSIPPSTRPYVTLTYACSLDGSIALAPGTRTTLSGPETKSMTHYLRFHHDAILVGVGTAIADDPSLNCRYPDVDLDTQPRPVIVDPQMRWNLRSSKACALAAEKKGKAPWTLHLPGQTNAEVCSAGTWERLTIGKNGMAHVDEADQNTSNTQHRMPWQTILPVLKQKGIRSVMIEGGATIINDLLAQPSLVDSVIVTIAPTWLGQGGVHVSPEARFQEGQRVNAARLSKTAWRQFGEDVVLCGTLNR